MPRTNAGAQFGQDSWLRTLPSIPIHQIGVLSDVYAKSFGGTLMTNQSLAPTPESVMLLVLVEQLVSRLIPEWQQLLH